MRKRELIDRSEAYVYWSFIGIVLPIVGIVLLIIANSRLAMVGDRKLSQDDRERIHSIKGMTRISASLLVIMSVLGLLLVVNEYHQQTKKEEQAQQYIENVLRYY